MGPRKKITRAIRKYFESNENENNISPLRVTIKAVLRWNLSLENLNLQRRKNSNK